MHHKNHYAFRIIMLLVCDAIKAFYKGIIELMPEFDLEYNLRD